MPITARYNNDEKCLVIIHKTKHREIMTRLDLNKREMNSLIKQLQKAVAKEDRHDLFKV